MIIVTGGAGFIGSCIVKRLNDLGRKDIIMVDNLGTSEKWLNLRNLKYINFIHKNDFFDELPNLKNVELIIHMGACTSTTEQDANYLMKNNFIYSKKIYDYCAQNNVRLIYASSAATYGNGDNGYDDEENIDNLLPLNMYGYSKHLFDQYLKEIEGTIENKMPPQCVGLKFFNVYGPNEYHKETMASVMFHSFNQIKKNKVVKLFKSYKSDYKHGEQKRDFVYVKDVVSVIEFFLNNPKKSGLFNLGTGKARSFNDLANSVFDALGLKRNIEYIDMPGDLDKKYQYFTESKMKKLREIGYTKEFFKLEDGIADYVQKYLDKNYSNI